MVKLTNQDKIFWPKEKITKGDLVEYYASISSYILPYLKNRPTMLHRFPNGIRSEGFYQKNLEDHPDWLKTITIQHEQENRKIHYPVVQNKETLIFLANLGTIDFHPFLSPNTHLKRPDYLIFDLDPVGISFDAVVETALALHEILEEAKVKNYCKTSGGRGLHIYIPLSGQLDFDEARGIARSIAQLVKEKLPSLVSLERIPAKRKRKVYIDFLRNAWGQTTVCPYSVRPLPHAPVSTPLLWKEVKKGLNPLSFTIHTVPKRLKSKGDIFKTIFKKNSVKKLHALVRQGL